VAGTLLTLQESAAKLREDEALIELGVPSKARVGSEELVERFRESFVLRVLKDDVTAPQYEPRVELEFFADIAMPDHRMLAVFPSIEPIACSACAFGCAADSSRLRMAGGGGFWRRSARARRRDTNPGRVPLRRDPRRSTQWLVTGRRV
jgi:hypothetical protein